MNATTVQVIIVNWKWDTRLGYPCFEVNPNVAPQNGHKHKFDWGTHITDKKIPFISVKENVINEEEAPRTTKWLLPTSLSNEIKKKDLQAKEFPLQYVETLRKMIIDYPFEGKTEDTKVHLLFLLHKGDGFETHTGREAISKGIAGYSSQIQYHFFGGGDDMIYRKKGFLDMGAPTFRFKKKHAAGLFETDNKRKIRFLKEELFDQTWEHYWYQTQKRLLAIRRMLGLYEVSLQLAPTSDSNQAHASDIQTLRQKGKEVAVHLQAHLQASSNGAIDSTEEREEWCLNGATDLREMIDHKLPTEAKSHLEKQLNHLIQGETVDWPALHEALNALIVLFNK
ncbi:MAG: hypothetical protein AAFW00_21165 [Bacteroidota bacterium]